MLPGFALSLQQPILASLYQQAKAANKPFEIIFCLWYGINYKLNEKFNNNCFK
jgi:hypothetical protein